MRCSMLLSPAVAASWMETISSILVYPIRSTAMSEEEEEEEEEEEWEWEMWRRGEIYRYEGVETWVKLLVKEMFDPTVEMGSSFSRDSDSDMWCSLVDIIFHGVGHCKFQQCHRTLPSKEKKTISSD